MPVAPVSVPPEPYAPTLRERVQGFLRRNARVLWWVHSAYALCMGLGVVLFAQRGFEHARILSVSVGIAWLLVVLLFRFAAKNGAARGLAFYAMTYVLKNLYQGMLFFLLPFYFKSASSDHVNFAIVIVLGCSALLSTLDVVFDRVLMRFPILGSLFHGLTLFACLNLVVPALFPDTRTLLCECVAAGLAVLSFFTIHLRPRWFLRGPVLLMIVASVGLAAFGVYQVRRYLPPVPMVLAHAAVGPAIREDGTLTMEVSALDTRSLQRLVAVTDVVLPAGKGDRILHVWRLHREEAPLEFREEITRVPGAKGGVRLRSMLSHIPKAPEGEWTVDVETADGQLIGRAHFKVVR
jgi:hypothetical protein